MNWDQLPPYFTQKENILSVESTGTDGGCRSVDWCGAANAAAFGRSHTQMADTQRLLWHAAAQRVESRSCIIGSSRFKGENARRREGGGRKCGICGSAEQMFSPPPSSPASQNLDHGQVEDQIWQLTSGMKLAWRFWIGAVRGGSTVGHPSDCLKSWWIYTNARVALRPPAPSTGLRRRISVCALFQRRSTANKEPAWAGYDWNSADLFVALILAQVCSRTGWQLRSARGALLHDSSWWPSWKTKKVKRPLEK